MSHPPSRSDDADFDRALRVTQRWLMMLICAVGTGRYFDSWRAAVQLQVALDRAERLSHLVSNEPCLNASRLNTIRSIAAQTLALAATSSRPKLCQIRGSGVDTDRYAWDHGERQWQRSVLQASFHPTMQTVQYLN